MPDPYEIIGVRRDASLDEIRIAYRRSAQVLHPDRFATSSDGVRSEAARRMLQLNGAMEAIELERVDEASGTGGLGSVSFGPRSPGSATASPPASAPTAAPLRSAPTMASPASATGPNGSAAPSETPPAPQPKPSVELPHVPAAPPKAAETPAAKAPPAPVDPEAPATPAGRELAAWVAPAEAEAEAESAAADTPAEPLEPRRDPFEPVAPTSRPRPTAPTPRPKAPPQPGPEQRSYSLNADHAFSFEDDDDDDDLPPVAVRARQRAASRSVVPALIAGVVIVVALAVIAGYFLFGRSGGTGEQAFARSGAPFTFRYPKDFHQRRLDGGIALNKPIYQVGFGLDEDNYLLASTYKLGFTVESDGSATGPKGQQLTPDQINHDIDVTIAKLAGQAGFTQKGVESGSLGSLRARIYDYAKADGSLESTFVVALSGTTEYYVTCQSSPKGATRIAKACDRLISSFSPA